MRPLEDVRIIAVEQYGAGPPFGSVHLADLGADVLKIEEPTSGGDVGRYVPPYNKGEDSLFFETFNRNKRSLSLDLGTPGGRKVFEDLVRTSDAVYSNLRGDVPAKIKITYDDLKHLNPAIVCCSLTGFGMTGPRAKQPGYDYILQGLAGWMDLTGDPDGPPTKSGLSLVDFCGGYVAALSLMAGLHAARRDGGRRRLRRLALRHRHLDAHLPGRLAPQRRLPSGPYEELRASLAGAVPGLRGLRRVVRRRLRQGEVLGAAGRGHRSHRAARRPAVHRLRRPRPAQGRTAALAGEAIRRGDGRSLGVVADGGRCADGGRSTTSSRR